MDNASIVRLIHPSKAVVSIALPFGIAITPADVALMIANVNTLLAGGFAVSEADVLDGDEITLTHVVRGIKPASDGKPEVTRLYFYTEWSKTSSAMTHYLDEPQDRAEFERVSGLNIDKMPLFDLDKKGPVQGTPGFTRYAVPVNFKVIRRKVEGKGGEDKGRWELVKYVGCVAPAAPAPAAAPSQPSAPAIPPSTAQPPVTRVQVTGAIEDEFDRLFPMNAVPESGVGVNPTEAWKWIFQNTIYKSGGRGDFDPQQMFDASGIAFANYQTTAELVRDIYKWAEKNGKLKREMVR